MPGYQGFVPRINPTQIGLGQRFKNRTQLVLNDVAQEQERHWGEHSAIPPSQRSSIPTRATLAPRVQTVTPTLEPGPVVYDQ